jgi:hypothetical protein
MLGIGLLNGGYGEDELVRAGGFRVSRAPSDLHFADDRNAPAEGGEAVPSLMNSLGLRPEPFSPEDTQ